MSQTIDHQVSISQILPGVSVSLNARPYASFDVVVFSSPGDEPAELYSGLRAVGFTPRLPSAQPAGMIRQSFGRDGSALLWGWAGSDSPLSPKYPTPRAARTSPNPAAAAQSGCCGPSSVKSAVSGKHSRC